MEIVVDAVPCLDVIVIDHVPVSRFPDGDRILHEDLSLPSNNVRGEEGKGAQQELRPPARTIATRKCEVLYLDWNVWGRYHKDFQ